MSNVSIICVHSAHKLHKPCKGSFVVQCSLRIQMISSVACLLVTVDAGGGKGLETRHVEGFGKTLKFEKMEMKR